MLIENMIIEIKKRALSCPSLKKTKPPQKYSLENYLLLFTKRINSAL